MIRLWHVMVFVVVMGAAIAALAPARLLIHPRQGDVSFNAVEGTIWSPLLKSVRVGRLDAGDVAIAVAPFDLLLGRLTVDARIHGSDIRGDVRLERQLGGDLRIAAPSLVIDGGLLAGLEPAAGKTQLGGVDIVFADRACRSGAGTIESDTLALAAAKLGGNGPTLAGGVSCAGAVARIAMSGERDSDRASALLDLASDGTASWSVTYATNRPEMAAGLIAAGLPPETQAGVYTSRGAVRWLPF